MPHRFPLCRVQLDVPALLIDSHSHPPLAYTSYLPREACHRDMAALGLHLYMFPAYLAGRGINVQSGIGPFRNGIWTSEETFDFTDIINDLEMILAADPDARVVMRLHLDVPVWWEKKHPDGCRVRRDGSLLRQSFTSPIWLDAATKAIERVIAWLAGSRYAPHLVGIHLAAGATEEWFHHHPGEPSDRNPARLAGFTDYLREIHPSLDARRAAWRHSPQQDEASALAAIEHPPEKRWLDPIKDAAALDARRFHSTTIVDAIQRLCHVAKAACDRRLLVGVFYGYHFYVADMRRGHTALSRLLDCPDLDYLASPNVYDRSPGLDWMPMAAVESVRLHGKLWLAENDTRTALTRPLDEVAPQICPPGQYRGGVWQGPDNLDVSAALLRANTARMLTNGYGGWWFDMWGGWFAHPRLLDELAAAQRLWPQATRSPAPGHVAAHTLCVVVDERIAERDGSFGALCGAIMSNRFALGHCGRPFRLYLRNDLHRLSMDPKACLWLLGLDELTDSEQSVVDGHNRAGVAVLHTDLSETRLHHPGGVKIDRGAGVTLSTDALRAMLDAAGVHCWLDTPDVLYVGRGFAAVHTASAGPKRLQPPDGSFLLPVLPGGPSLPPGTVIDMKQHETRIFRIA